MPRRRLTPQKFRPNPKRQAILAGLALIGIAIGYGVGYLSKGDQNTIPPAVIEKPEAAVNHPTPAGEPQIKAPQTAPSSMTAQVVMPEDYAGNGRPLAYEEALPRETIDFPKLSEPPSTEDQYQFPHTFASPEPEPEPEQTDPPELDQAKPMADADTLLETTPSPGPPTTKPEDAEVAVATVASDETSGTDKPLWQKNALVIELSDKPKIAIVIDDMGVDQRRSLKATELQGPLTLAYLTYARDLAAQTKQAQKSGHELMLHVPMEPSSQDVDPGPNVLLSGVPAPEILAALKWGLDQFEGFIGINNHMGSRFTSNLEGMKTVMRELKRRELAFLDSVTSGGSKGRTAAQQIGVPFIARNIFLDHIDDVKEIRNQLAKVERLAKQKGFAVAIGHPRDATLKALEPWLQSIEQQGFQLVPVSALLNQPTPPKIVSNQKSTQGEN